MKKISTCTNFICYEKFYSRKCESITGCRELAKISGKVYYFVSALVNHSFPKPLPSLNKRAGYFGEDSVPRAFYLTCHLLIKGVSHG